LCQYLKENKKGVDLMLFTKWDRFSRNAGESYHQINVLQKMGINPYAIEQPLDLTIPEQLLMLAVYLSVPEVENKRRSLNVIAGMRRSAKEGRYVGSTPRGYNSERDFIGKPMLVPNELAKSIRTAFEMIATGKYSQREVREVLSSNGVKISRSQLSVILRNPIYMGYVKVKPYNDEKEELVKGIHDPIISEDLFYQVQNITSGRTNKQLSYKTASLDMFPLRGLIECDKCGRNLTASSAKGNGGMYYYYHCSDGCKNIISTKVIHAEVHKILSNLMVKPEIRKLYQAMLKEELQTKSKYEKGHRKNVNKQLENIQTKIQKTQDLFIDGQLDQDDYNQIIRRLKTQASEIKSKLTGNASDIDYEDLRRHLNWGFGYVKNLHKHYRKADTEGKRLIIGLMFPQKFTFEKERLQTSHVDETFQLLCNGSKGFKRIKKRDDSKNLNLSRLVTLGGESSNFLKEDMASIIAFD
jgi:site-specific DNA recombinase